ncbi:hypothetical protein L3Q82_009103 [Scortum barcoo]|uniref:Uncharacterized protein n=1 Tax=Scortum barcoo TaxID=214431 RepID=A0ACB8XAZ1_9TELE|nr:hypothetical protein L3Q82_009103 [Scortum barcoo]
MMISHCRRPLTKTSGDVGESVLTEQEIYRLKKLIVKEQGMMGKELPFLRLMKLKKVDVMLIQETHS